MNVGKGLLGFVRFIKKHFIFLWPKVKSLAPGYNQELNLSLNQATCKKKNTTNAKQLGKQYILRYYL